MLNTLKITSLVEIIKDVIPLNEENVRSFGNNRNELFIA